VELGQLLFDHRYELPHPFAVEYQPRAGGFEQVGQGLGGAERERGERLEGLTVTRPTLEDVYLELTV